MSEAINYVKVQNVSFVLPTAGNLVFARIQNRDRLLCFTLTKGYIETSSYASCVVLSEFLLKTSKTKFRMLGNMSKVKKTDKLGDYFVYRQRVCFTDLVLMLKIFSKMDVVIRMSEDLKITDSNITISRKDKENISKLAESKNMDYLTWLTLTLKMQITRLCENLGVTYEGSPLHKNGDSLLINAPYILTGFNMFGKNAIVAVFHEKEHIGGYSFKLKSNTIALNGYTKRNASRCKL